MGESTVSVPLRVPKTLIVKMKRDGYQENFGCYLEEIYDEKDRKYLS